MKESTIVHGAAWAGLGAGQEDSRLAGAMGSGGARAEGPL